MRDSISLIPHARCLGLSPVILVKTHCSNVRRSIKYSLETRYFSISMSFKVIGVGTPGKLVSSAFCYDKQQVCVYVQPLNE